MVRSCSSCKIVDEIFSLIEYFLVMSGSVGFGGRGDGGCLNCNKKIHSCVVTSRRVGGWPWGIALTVIISIFQSKTGF